jgi:hypothetical protein
VANWEKKNFFSAQFSLTEEIAAFVKLFLEVAFCVMADVEASGCIFGYGQAMRNRCNLHAFKSFRANFP